MSAGSYQYSQGRSRVLSYVIDAPANASGTAVHAAVTDTGASQTITTGLTQPDAPRNISATAGGTSANITAVAVTVHGTDAHGNAISETLPAFVAATAATKTGSKAFATVTSVVIPANGTGVTTSIGVGNKFGLPVKLERNTVVFAFLDDVREATAPTVTVDADNLENNTVTLNSSPDGTSDIVIDYYNNG